MTGRAKNRTGDNSPFSPRSTGIERCPACRISGPAAAAVPSARLITRWGHAEDPCDPVQVPGLSHIAPARLASSRAPTSDRRLTALTRPALRRRRALDDQLIHAAQARAVTRGPGLAAHHESPDRHL